MTPPRRRPPRAVPRTAAVAAAAAGVLLGAGAVPPAQAAPWQGSAARTTTVSTAQLASELRLTSGAGTLAPGGDRFSLSTTLSSATGYLELANTSTAAAAPSVTVTLSSLVASTPAVVCTRPWDTAADTCPGTATTIGLAPVLGTQTGTWTAPTPLPAGAGVHLRVRTSGVAGAVTVVTNPVVPRPAADRTAA